MNRLTGLPTLRIDPDQPLSFIYRGRKMTGLKGDSIATALYAEGVRIFSRSIKYHRPRGLYSLDGECGNCLMDVDGFPNIYAETEPLREGIAVTPQNVKGSPEWDLLGFMDKLDWAMPAGFYYRRFHKPYAFWPTFLRQIRRRSGIGRLNPDFRAPGTYEERHIHADVCVIGAGPAGMSAALAAGELGLRTVLLEARPWPGGWDDHRVAPDEKGAPLHEAANTLWERVRQTPSIRTFLNATAAGCYPGWRITGVQRGTDDDPFVQQYLEIQAPAIVVAAGCTERPLIFDNNDRPGVMQIGCVHRLARTWGVPAGKQVAFGAGHDMGLEAALDLHDLGVDVAVVAVCRPDGQDPVLADALAERNIPLMRGWTASKAHGGKRLNKVTLSTIEGVRQKDVDCDILAASAGLTPRTGLLSLAGASLAYDVHTGFYLPENMPDGAFAGGRMLGYDHPAAVTASGRLAGLLACRRCGVRVDDLVKETRELLEGMPGPIRGSKLIQAPVKVRRRFVCFDEDVTVKHVDQAAEMGFDKVELAKRFTAAGTGTGQGGVPGHNLPLLLSQYHAAPPDAAVPSRVRPPLAPASLAAYAGRHPGLIKQTPLHAAQASLGAVFRAAGNWRRARYFSEDVTCREEIENVRNNVGVMDVSTLGKFKIYGPDAQKALQRVYVGDMAAVRPDRVAYSVMCNEDGCVLDDGLIVRRGRDDFYFTTSTARAGQTAEWITYHARYEDWDFHMVDLTDAFAAVNLAGPNARKVLEKITGADVSADAFPFLGYREFKLSGGVPVRVIRSGFVGELAFEIHVPASLARTVWDMIMDAGEAFEIRPFGLEAQNVLRLEKGHVIIGQETEIRTTLHDVGLGRAWRRDAAGAATIGVPALKFTRFQEGRLKLAGFKMTDAERPPRDGSIIVNDGIQGHVCTARFSFALNEPVGMALVTSDLARPGAKLEIFEDGAGKNRLHGVVVPMPFYDPEGLRQQI